MDILLDDDNFNGRIKIAKQQYINGISESEIISMLCLDPSESSDEIQKAEWLKELGREKKKKHEEKVNNIVNELKKINVILLPKVILILKALSAFDLKKNFSDPLQILTNAGIPFTETMQDAFFKEETQNGLTPLPK